MCYVCQQMVESSSVMNHLESFVFMHDYHSLLLPVGGL